RHRAVFRLVENRTAYPGSSLVGAGIHAVGRSRVPDAPGSIDVADPHVDLPARNHHRGFHLGALTFVNHVGSLFLRLDDLSIGLPVGPRPADDPGFGPRQDHAVRGLRHVEDIASLESVTLLGPGGAVIVGDKHTAVDLIVHYAGQDGLRGFGIDQEAGHLTLR